MSRKLNRVLLCLGLVLGVHELSATSSIATYAGESGETETCAPCTTQGEDSPYTHTWINVCCVPNTAGCHRAESTEVGAPLGVFPLACNVHPTC